MRIDFGYINKYLDSLHKQRDIQANQLIENMKKEIKELNEDYFIDVNTQENKQQIYLDYLRDYQNIGKKIQENLIDLFKEYSEMSTEFIEEHKKII